MEPPQSLAGVRVIESAGWNGVLAGRLLAEAGADVLRIVPSAGDPLAAEPPFFPGSHTSIQATWYNAGKRILRLDLDRDADRERFRDLLRGADILLEDWTPGTEPLPRREVPRLNRRLVHVSVTPFGTEGPMATFRVNDLVQNALSGSASVTGSFETPPLSGYGNQSHHTVGLYAAVAALAGLHLARAAGEGVVIDLSAYEALTSCTEQVLMQWFFADFPSFASPIAPRRGSLHWSGAYAVYPTQTWPLMVTAALRLQDALLPWLIEEDAAGDLVDRSRFPDLAAMVASLPYLMQVIRDFVGRGQAESIFHEAQRRHQSWAPAWDVATATSTPQIRARGYLQRQEVPGAGKVELPAGFVRVNGHPRRPGAAEEANPESVPWPPRDDREPTAAAAGAGPGRPLAGVRILDFTHVLAGPFGTRLLADLGADVIKVGSAARSVASNSHAHPYYRMWNRNKRSVFINMASPRGRQLARDLAGRCDVIIDNFSAGVLRRWGLDRASLAVDHPGVTVISMAGLGQDGPWRDYVTFAPTIHALIGLTHLTSFPGASEPLGYGFSLTDHLSGIMAAYAALEALHHRSQTGQGLEIDLAQYELGLGLMAPAVIDFLSSGANPAPVGNRHPYGVFAPHGIYRTAGDDRWVALAVSGDEQWRRLCSLMSRPDLAHDLRFASHAARLANADAVDAAVEAWTRTVDRFEVMNRCQSAGIAAGVVQDAEDLAACAQHTARKFFRTVSDPATGEQPADSFPALWDGRRIEASAGVHEVGADTFAVLQEVLGMGDEEVAALVADGTLT